MSVIFKSLWIFISYVPLTAYLLWKWNKRRSVSTYVAALVFVLAGAISWNLAGCFTVSLWIMGLAAVSSQFALLGGMMIWHRQKQSQGTSPDDAKLSIQWLLLVVVVFLATLFWWLRNLAAPSWLYLFIPTVAILCSIALVSIFLFFDSSPKRQKALLLLLLSFYVYMVGQDGWKHLSSWRRQLYFTEAPRLNASQLVQEAMSANTLTPYSSLLKTLPDGKRKEAIRLLADKFAESKENRIRALSLLSEVLDNRSLAELIAEHWDYNKPFGDKMTLAILAACGELQYADLILSAWNSDESSARQHVVYSLERLLVNQLNSYLVQKLGSGLSEEAAWAWDILVLHAGGEAEAQQAIVWLWQDDYMIRLPDVAAALQHGPLSEGKVQALLNAYTSPESIDELKQSVIVTFNAKSDEAIRMLSPYLRNVPKRHEVLDILNQLSDRTATHQMIRSVWQPSEPIASELVAEALSDRAFIAAHPEFIVGFLHALRQAGSAGIQYIAQQVLEETPHLAQNALETVLDLARNDSATVRGAAAQILFQQFQSSDIWWLERNATRTLAWLIHRMAGKAEDYPQEAYELLLRIAPFAASKYGMTSQEWLQDAIIKYWPENDINTAFGEVVLAFSTVRGTAMNSPLIDIALNPEMETDIRKRSLKALCRLNTDVGTVRLLLNHFSDYAKARAAWTAIGEIIRFSETTIPLRELIRQDWKQSYYIPSVEVLVYLAEDIRPEYLPSIIRCLGLQEPEIEEAARQTLLQYDTQILLPVLLKQLSDNSVTMRTGIIRLLPLLNLNSKQKEPVIRTLKRICGVGLFQFRVRSKMVVVAAFDALMILNR